MWKNSSGLWQCTVCDHTSQHTTNMKNHIEVKHVGTAGYYCQQCHKFCRTKNALSIHRTRYKHWLILLYAHKLSFYYINNINNCMKINFKVIITYLRHCYIWRTWCHDSVKNSQNWERFQMHWLWLWNKDEMQSGEAHWSQTHQSWSVLSILCQDMPNETCIKNAPVKEPQCPSNPDESLIGKEDFCLYLFSSINFTYVKSIKNTS